MELEFTLSDSLAAYQRQVTGSEVIVFRLSRKPPAHKKQGSGVRFQDLETKVARRSTH